MKNKGVTYLLLVIVCAIWGIIIFRIIKGMSGDEEINTINNSQPYTNNDKAEETYDIIASYRDPFLGGIRQSYSQNELSSSSTPQPKPAKPKSVVVKPITPAQPPTPAIVIDWSFIHFKGLISNKGGKAVGIVSINGNEHIVKNNDKLSDVKILSVSKDSILIQYKGFVKGISK